MLYLELIKLPNFQNDIGWIVKTLDLSTVEAQLALERLERLKLIQLNNDGNWILNSENNCWDNNEFTTVSRKNHQKQVLDLALKAIDDVEFSQRDNSSLTIACDPKLIPEIKEKIKKFGNEMDQFVQSKGQVEEVYQFAIAFFPLSKGEKSNENN